MSTYLRIGALVEVVAAADGSVSESLLGSAYGASDDSFIVLAHRGVSARTIDGILDRIVARHGLRANGVIYADGEDVRATVELARRARVIIAETPTFQEALSAAGLPFFPATQAAEAFARVRRSESALRDGERAPARHGQAAPVLS